MGMIERAVAVAIARRGLDRVFKRVHRQTGPLGGGFRAFITRSTM